MTYAIKTGLFGLALAFSAVAQGRFNADVDEGRAAMARVGSGEESRPELVASDDPGIRTYIVRGSSVAGVRVHFTDFAVPAGSAVFVQNQDGSESYGPFTGAGPTQDSQFLSPIVHGNTVRIVLQSERDVPPVLPYTVARVESATAEDVARFDAARPAPLGDDGAFRTSLYGGVPITHATVGGLAIHEGDILLGETRNLQAVDAETTKGMQRRSFGLLAFPSSLWPQGVIPYEVDGTVVSVATVTAAVNAWNTTFGNNVQLVPHTNQSNYVFFTRNSTPSTCSSYVGMVGGGQPIYVGDYCTTGNLIHEIGHAFGLLHEHTRLDRNSYVTINSANINSAYSSNFDIVTYATDLGAYDFGSIMHYPSTAFSINGLPTIVTKPAGIPIGQRNALSAGDIAGVNKMYPPAAGTTTGTTTTSTSTSANTTVTFATNPPGLLIYVDGVFVGTPKTLTAPAGTVHTIQARTMVNSVAGVRFVFGGWSNGAAATWTLTMPTTDTTYIANYTKQYYVNASAGTGGTATVSPSDADGWYNAGTTVQFTAVPQSGYSFLYWAGFAAGTPSSTSLTVNAPYSPTANFVASASAVRFNIPSATFDNTLGYGGVYLFADGPFTIRISAPWVSCAIWPGSTYSGTSSMNIPYVVQPNTTGVARTATITAGSAVFTITQQP